MEKRKRFPEMVDNDPWEYVRVALAIETLYYHDRNYLDHIVCNEKLRSEEIQALLIEALEKAKKSGQL